MFFGEGFHCSNLCDHLPDYDRVVSTSGCSIPFIGAKLLIVDTSFYITFLPMIALITSYYIWNTGGGGGGGCQDPKWWNIAPVRACGWVGVMYRNQLRSLGS